MAHNSNNKAEEPLETFSFPIKLPDKEEPMKNISPFLPTFKGTTTEDPNIFLFEFDVLYRSYDYVKDAQKLKLFPYIEGSNIEMVHGTF